MREMKRAIHIENSGTDKSVASATDAMLLMARKIAPVLGKKVAGEMLRGALDDAVSHGLAQGDADRALCAFNGKGEKNDQGK